MKLNYANTLNSSFLLFLDNAIQKRGEGYSNVSSLFYTITGVYNGYYTYGAPYKQIVSDASITGAIPFTGVYVNGSFIVPGQSGLVAINHYDGELLFSSDQSGKTISGNYAIKDFNVYLTDKGEDRLLFETKLNYRSRKPQKERGLQSNEITYPAIFLRTDHAVNDPFAFGGVDMTKTNFRTVVMADSLFNLDAACGILMDSSHTYFRTIDNNDLRLNAMNSYTGSLFNYTSIATGDPIYISDARALRIKTISDQDFVNLNPNVYSAFVDFEVQSIRQTHAY
jgi:hypothetical protein